MRRKSGEPYILHPLAVAKICVEEIDLVYAVPSAPFARYRGRYGYNTGRYTPGIGNEIAKIVDGFTKISTVMDTNSPSRLKILKDPAHTLADRRPQGDTDKTGRPAA